MTPIKLQLDWKPNAQFAGILLAHYQGLYEQAGIDLDILPWQSHTNPMDALRSEANVIVSTEDNLLIRARAAGEPVKAIGTMMQFSGIGWMVLKSSGIRSVQDFKGKRVGIHGDGETALVIALSQFGLTRDDVEIVDVGFNYDELLNSGEFAAVQCLVMVEPLELESQGFELEVIPAYDWGYRVYAQVLATTERLLAAEPAALTQFLRITFEGWRAALQDPNTISQIIAEHYLPEAEPTQQAQMLMAMQPLLLGDSGPEKMGLMAEARWKQSIDYLLAHGMITQSLTPNDVMTPDLIEAAYQKS